MKKFSLLLLVFCSFLIGRSTAAFFAAEKDVAYIIIDPGHGGNDPGKVGEPDILEKDINLLLALRLAQLFENKGYHVILTRDCDKYVSLEERTSLVAKYNPVFTISLHQNSFPEPSVSGPQVFYYTNSTEGKALATAVQKSLNTRLNIPSPREITANDSYYILKKAPTLTILIECGFLSNPSEASSLLTEQYQNKLVRAIYLGVMEYAKSLP